MAEPWQEIRFSQGVNKHGVRALKNPVAGTAVIHVPADYSTIQAAVNEAGANDTHPNRGRRVRRAGRDHQQAPNIDRFAGRSVEGQTWNGEITCRLWQIERPTDRKLLL